MSGIVPAGYTRLADAYHLVAEVLHAGVDFSEAVRNVRLQGYDGARLSVEELEASARAFWEQIDSSHKPRLGGQPIEIWAEQPAAGTLVSIDPDILRTVPFARSYKVGSLAYLRPKHPYFRQLADRLGRPLGRVQLLVRDTDLARVVRDLRRTRKRKEGRHGDEPATPRGRPSKREAVEEAIVQIVNGNRWRGAQSSKTLVSVLSRPPYSLQFSEPTVRRALDSLFEVSTTISMAPYRVHPLLFSAGTNFGSYANAIENGGDRAILLLHLTSEGAVPGPAGPQCRQRAWAQQRLRR